MAVPVKHKMYIRIFYKWSSENRFFCKRIRDASRYTSKKYRSSFYS